MRCKFQTKLNPHLLPQYPIHWVSDSCRCKALVVRYASNTELGVVVAHLQIPTSGMLRPEAYITDQPELQNDRRKVFINRIWLTEFKIDIFLLNSGYIGKIRFILIPENDCMKHWIYKHEVPFSVSRTHIRSRVWRQMFSLRTARWKVDRQVPEGPFPASLAHLVKVPDQWELSTNKSGLHTHVHTYACVHSHTCVKPHEHIHTQICEWH